MPADHDNESVNANSGQSDSEELKSVRPLLSPSDAAGSPGRLALYDVQKVQGQGALGIVLQGKDSKLQRAEWIRGIVGKLQARQSTERFQSTIEARELWVSCETQWLRGDPLSDELRRRWELPNNSSVDPAQSLVCP